MDIYRVRATVDVRAGGAREAEALVEDLLSDEGAIHPVTTVVSITALSCEQGGGA